MSGDKRTFVVAITGASGAIYAMRTMAARRHRPARGADEPPAAEEHGPLRRSGRDDPAGHARVLSDAEDARRPRGFHGGKDPRGPRPEPRPVPEMGRVIDKSPARIASMFDAIAKRYDLLNHVLSVGLDVRWRARAIREAHLAAGARVLDLCTGTADFAIAAVHAAPKARIVGVDFAGAMLRVGLDKLRGRTLERQITLVRGDATAIPVRDGWADAATIGFGIRMVAHAAVGPP